MWYEVAQALVQRILRDKILLGLVIIGILGIFMGGMNKEEPRRGAHDEQAQQMPESQGPQQQKPAADPVDPKLATDFLKWWMGGAFDYSPKTAAQSHQQAIAWMTPEAAAQFKTSFWTPETAQGIQSGQLVAAFHPISIEAEAVNPDGSVVVSVAGSVDVQQGGQAFSQQLLSDFLVSRHRDGLRVAGIYNRAVPAAEAAPAVPAVAGY